MAPKRNLYPSETEALTGLVQEKNASDLEERSARALNKLPDWSYIFRIRISPLTGELTQSFRNIAGEYEIGFLCTRGSQMRPILVDGEVSHFMAQWQKDVDLEREIIINKALKKYGAHPAVRIPYWELSDQRRADTVFRELLL